jgi:hypothetical protein
VAGTATIELLTDESGKPPATNGGRAKPGPKPRRSGEETVRFFLPKPGSSPNKPELGEEVQSEAEAQIRAFRTQQPYYTITAFTVDADMRGERPTLVARATRP